jgi:hypothetical protein
LFAILKNRFDENLEKFNQVIEKVVDKGNIFKWKSKIGYLENINEIRI